MPVKEKSSIPLLAAEAPLPLVMALGLYVFVWLKQTLDLFPQLLRDFSGDSYVPLAQREAIATLAIWFSLDALFIIAMVYQKNWGRLGKILSAIIGLVLLCRGVCGEGDFKPGITYLFDVTATLLLFLPSVDAWLKKRP
ncbi:MAG TPA: hypothetical protein VG320_00050 [Paraburkholderia sp.]|jgi:hypothetical protein|uniref:hypothetical protein n=1 Tax=Paraburkholderia sp. TaxID=1926495 RepID=UPI002DF2A0F9|nr:hypothetical protein [Paraburkholderia sp.]